MELSSHHRSWLFQEQISAEYSFNGFRRVLDVVLALAHHSAMRKPIAVIAASVLIVSSISSSASVAATKNPIPITLPVKPVGTITFENIEQRISEVPAAGYKALQDVYAANSQPKIPMTILMGPNTVNPSDAKVALNKIAKLWSGFRQPVSYHALVYNFKDKAWALKADAKVPVVAANGGSRGRASMSSVINQCTADQCGSANSGISDAKGSGYGQFQVSSGENGPYQLMGGVFGHEYTHSVQAAQFLGNANVNKPVSKDRAKYGLDNSPSGLFQGVLPCWMSEGMANFNGTAVVAPTFEKYMEWRKDAPKGQQTPDFTNFSAKSIENYLLTANPPKCLPPAGVYLMGYTLGALTVEALSAIAGPQGAMAVVTLLGRGQTFPQAFKSVYGITWAEAAPILAKVVAAEYAATP